MSFLVADLSRFISQLQGFVRDTSRVNHVEIRGRSGHAKGT